VHPGFSCITTLSRPEPGWIGATGRVTKLVEERVLSVANLAVYLCGNGGMIRDVTTILQGRGLCPIYREKYYDG
jgi:NAD(P)H-flavin reductase